MNGVRFRLTVMAGAVAAVVAWGCSGKPSVSSSNEEATVRGTVTIKGKKVSRGDVVFDPSNYQRKFASERRAPIQEDGSYEVTTLVGTNRVRVDSPDAAKASVGYSTIDFEVQPGENPLDIVLPIPPVQ